MKKRRRRIGDRGVASAIAVLFLILIVVAGLNAYLVNTLPQDMAVLEEQHMLEVENAFVQLQADILAEAAHPNQHVLLNTPIPLQSGGEPPFGSPATSVVAANPTTSAVTNFSYKIGTVRAIQINWSKLGVCGPSGNNITCKPNIPNGLIVYNVSGNGTTLSINVNGCGKTPCAIIYNITGSNDTIKVNLQGNNVGNVTVIIEGNHDNVMFSFGGNSGGHRFVQFWIYGQYDSYGASVNGAGSKSGGLTLNTTFIGYTGGLCPSSNLSSTDNFTGITVGNAENVTQNVTWDNNVGYNNFIGPIILNSHNSRLFKYYNSVFVACAFTKVSGANYRQASLSGLFDTLYNRYYPRETISFEEGAVIVGSSANSSSMVSGPLMTLTHISTGYIVNNTIIQMIPSGNMQQNGGGTMGIETHLLGISHFEFINTAASFSGIGNFLPTPFYLNVTTLYPNAWLTYFHQFPQILSGGAYAYPAPQNGYNTYNVIVPYNAIGFDMTVITVAVSFS